jgi:hypothetical protein
LILEKEQIEEFHNGAYHFNVDRDRFVNLPETARVKNVYERLA